MSCKIVTPFYAWQLDMPVQEEKEAVITSFEVISQEIPNLSSSNNNSVIQSCQKISIYIQVIINKTVWLSDHAEQEIEKANQTLLQLHQKPNKSYKQKDIDFFNDYIKKLGIQLTALRNSKLSFDLFLNNYQFLNIDINIISDFVNQGLLAQDLISYFDSDFIKSKNDFNNVDFNCFGKQVCIY